MLQLLLTNDPPTASQKEFSRFRKISYEHFENYLRVKNKKIKRLCGLKDDICR